jgi:hypothetical protein
MVLVIAKSVLVMIVKTVKTVVDQVIALIAKAVEKKIRGVKWVR